MIPTYIPRKKEIEMNKKDCFMVSPVECLGPGASRLLFLCCFPSNAFNLYFSVDDILLVKWISSSPFKSSKNRDFAILEDTKERKWSSIYFF